MRSLWLAVTFSIFGISICLGAPAGSVDTTFDIGVGSSGIPIRVIVRLPDNKILVGGDFQTWNGLAYPGLVRLNVDGSLDPLFRVESPVFMVTGAWRGPDEKVYVAGSFSQISGTPKVNFARLLSSGALDTTFTANPGSGVNDLVASAEGIFITGSFTQVNGVARPGVALLKANGDIDPSFQPEPGISGVGTGLFLGQGGNILAASLNWSTGTKTISGLLRLSPSGQVDKIFDLGSPSFFADRIFPRPGGNYFLQASFNNRRVLANDGIDQRFTNSLGTTLMELRQVQPDGRWFATGSSIKDHAGSVSSLARMFEDGKYDRSFLASLTGRVDHVAVRPDGRIIAAGFIAPAGGVRANRVLAVHGNDESAGPEIQWNATELEAIHSGRVFVTAIRSGNVASEQEVGWEAAFDSSLAVVNPASGSIVFRPGESWVDVPIEVESRPEVTTAIRLSLMPAAGLVLGTNQIISLFLTNQTGTVELAAGAVAREIQGQVSFRVTRTGPANRPASIAWRIAGANDPAKELTPISGVAGIEAGSSSETFSVQTTDDTLPDQDRNYTIELVEADPDWQPGTLREAPVIIQDNDLPGFPGRGANGPVSIAEPLTDGRVLVAGTFTMMHGSPVPHYAVLNKDGSADEGFRYPELDGPFSLVKGIPGGGMLMGGFFTKVDGGNFPWLARLGPDGTLDRTFVAQVPVPPQSLLPIADGYLVAGSSVAFNGTENGTNRGMVIKLDLNGRKDPNFKTFTSGGAGGLAGLPDGRFYVYGGVYGYVKGFRVNGPVPPADRQSILRFHPNGELDLSFQADLPWVQSGGVPPSSPKYVKKIHVYPDGRVLAGGTFNQVAGKTGSGLARFSSSGEFDAVFWTNASKVLGTGSVIHDFTVLSNGEIVLRGDRFSGPSNFPIHSFMLVLADDGSHLRPLGMPVADLIRSFPDDTVLMAGAFNWGGWIPRHRIAWFEPDGTLRPEPFVHFQQIERKPEGIELTLRSVATREVTIQQSSNFVNWLPMATPSLSNGNTNLVVPAMPGAAFFRVVP